MVVLDVVSIEHIIEKCKCLDGIIYLGFPNVVKSDRFIGNRRFMISDREDETYVVDVSHPILYKQNCNKFVNPHLFDIKDHRIEYVIRELHNFSPRLIFDFPDIVISRCVDANRSGLQQ